MTSAARTADSFTDHAVCAAAGLRDGLRTAQYYVRDMSRADEGKATPLSRLVAALARLADNLLSFGADWSIRLLLPQWRNLPSPFAPHMVDEVTRAIRENRLAMTSLFTAYFFRSAKHIIERCTETPALVLEHRIDAARRSLAGESSKSGPPGHAESLARALLTLAEARAIARIGPARPGYAFLNRADPNVSVMATACLALLLAEEGKPLETLDEDEFFSITGALLAPRLAEMERATAARDVAALARLLSAVRDLY
ncbi:MAG: hypothetical protein U1E15_07320 [Hyphomicrobiales bacterium]